MPKEIKILIPETNTNETVDIKVMTQGKELVNYRLEVWNYNFDKSRNSRAEFVKEQIDHYPSEYEVVEIDLDGDSIISILFRQMKAKIEERKC